MGELSERESLAAAIHPATCSMPGVCTLPFGNQDLHAADAALAWFAAHQPARVVPSAEEVGDELSGWPIGSGYYATQVGTDEARDMADAVLALCASQPTVAQVRGQVARELEALLPTDDEVADPQPCSAGHDCHEAARYVTVRRAQRIARGETKGGE